MKAVVIREHGGVEKLLLETLPDPEVGPGEVRVRIKACALNHLDLWVRRGLPHLKLSYPHILGSDIAGEVDSLGPGVKSLTLGQKVLLAPGVSCGICKECLAGRDNFCRSYGILGETRNGGYAEFITVPIANILPYPTNLDFAQAAAIPLAFQTAWQMLVDRAQIKPGETVLILAAGSGIGSAGVQIAKLFGAKVIATASSSEKLAQAQTLGADYLINHQEEDLVSAVKRITVKQGVEVVFEHVGAATWGKSILCCAAGGRIVTCGATTGWEAVTDLRHVFFRQLSILGSTMGNKAVLFEVLKHVQSGKLKPVLHKTFRLEEAALAHQLLEERKQFGKVVLIP